MLSNFLLGRTNESPAFCVRTATDSLGGQENRFQEQHTCLSRLERAGRERPQIASLKRFWRSGQVLSFTKNLGLEWQAMCAPTKAITIDVRVWCERERKEHLRVCAHDRQHLISGQMKLLFVCSIMVSYLITFRFELSAAKKGREKYFFFRLDLLARSLG